MPEFDGPRILQCTPERETLIKSPGSFLRVLFLDRFGMQAANPDSQGLSENRMNPGQACDKRIPTDRLLKIAFLVQKETLGENDPLR